MTGSTRKEPTTYENQARERKVFDLIKQGMPDNTITLLTGYSRAVIQAMRKDLERIERNTMYNENVQP